MRVIAITQTAVDLAAQKTPFLSGHTIVFNNPTAGALTVQEGDTASGTWSTVAVVPAHGNIEGTPRKQFIRVSTDATVYALGN